MSPHTHTLRSSQGEIELSGSQLTRVVRAPYWFMMKDLNTASASGDWMDARMCETAIRGGILIAIQV